jgi:hypothetical protein
MQRHQMPPGLSTEPGLVGERQPHAEISVDVRGRRSPSVGQAVVRLPGVRRAGDADPAPAAVHPGDELGSRDIDLQQVHLS